ncbi:GTP-binding protein [Paenibacillus hemerocallicola]|uniref:GTP-binding protein n=1 Tax=Paenibacillus hemerocallicola TaxID=1172614 RepID=A0A5C4SYG1_9BACL|nr:CobW family GTP-binding protein [Paenibacillus hemerocallicola]TNJ61838.1 GTP-binding protein [Paenibacillus hemerocallicola]
MDKRERTVPVYLLSGFLGSGKTTLLKRWLEAAEAAGRKPAVVMNELGDVNLDGIEIGRDVRMAEMLGGCICCTVRGDLGMEMLKLVEEHEPDLLLIESTGAANPMDIIDAIGDASMLKRVELKQVVTVVDAKHLQAQRDKGTGQTFRLMKEQIRCATVLILNKTDLVTDPEADELERLIREWNRFAPIYRTVGSQIDIGLLERINSEAASGRTEITEEPEGACRCGHSHSHAEHEHAAHEHAAHEHAHHSHEHVMAYTRYFDHPVNSEAFEEMMGRLPDNVYRAKGILSFTDTSSRFMFQYAYKQLDLMKINPQGEVPDVAVFIGEHFDRAELELLIRQLAG